MMIHSYQIVKKVVKTDDHEGASFLLNRVSTNISQFISSKINILTSTVIEVNYFNFKIVLFYFIIIKK